MVVKVKNTEKFDPLEIPGLIEKAKAGDLKARDELLYRFQRLIATLVNVCVSGRPNYRSSYQISLLRLFASKKVPLTTTAMALKRALSGYDSKELFSIGQLAVMDAIQKTETNLASTIVYCFKDELYKITKDPNNKPYLELDMNAHYTPDYENELYVEMLKTKLTDTENIILDKILNGTHTAIPEKLKKKLMAYMQ